ncbi:glycosyltransferase [Gilvimarinus polysaccharolyticus]|uniref:glycosyltransferase n=1 Tax=Gilvimarinus polysaccharolyticus TaxID=863921 RepID=UPI0006736200|nr:glycosyltransferase [Gilvimarinus polysaccharolyticus]
MQTALFVGYVWPEPNSSAAGRRILDLIDALQAGGIAVHFASAASPTEHQCDLAALNVTTHTIALNCASFDRWVAALAPEVVVFDRFVTEEQFGWRVATAAPKALRVLDTEDLHSLRAARELALKRALGAQPGADVGAITATAVELYGLMREDDMLLRELAAIFRCDLTLMISTFEIELLQRFCQVPASLLYHLPFTVDQPNNGERPDFAQREHFVSIGNFRHRPNWDAVLWLKQHVWPAIRRQLPRAELHIYGAYPPPKATALHNKQQGFLVKGWADDALTTVAQHKVLLAPLRVGAGIKGKLLDAMLTGTPNVTTSIGAESMQGECDWPGAIVDSSAAIAAEAVRLYQDQSYWQQAADACGPLLVKNYHRASLGPAFLAALHARYQNLTTSRRDNILGALFNYHGQRSTEFMSRWIEVKSRLAQEP